MRRCCATRSGRPGKRLLQPANTMATLHITPLLEATGTAAANATAGPIVLSTRVRLARNLAGLPFPGWAKEPQRREVLKRCREALATAPRMQDAWALDMEELTDLEKQILVERHLISRELAGGRHTSGVLISRDQSCSVMINEEDHLRLQLMRPGFRLKQLWKVVDGLDSHLEQQLDYSYTAELGYLTACPTNVGTGLRASAMMHLPGLVLAGQMEKVVRAANQLGLAVRGLFGEGTDASGHIFQISNQQTLGESEAEILRRLVQVLQAIMEQEANARQRLQEDTPVKLQDQIARAYGLIQQARLLTSGEAMKLLSLLRLATDLGFLPDPVRARVDRSFIECQPGHVQFHAHEEIEPEARDTFRARRMREQFGTLDALTFDPPPAVD